MEKTTETITRMFNAQSIAIVGASSDPGKFGYMTLNTLIEGGYEGRIYPVNPKAKEILGKRVYASLGEIPEIPDIAVIIVAAKLVPAILLEAADKGIKGAAILSAGFRDAGRMDLENEIKRISKECSIRLMGPNIQGISYLPNKMCAMFFPPMTKIGPLAIITQSGSLTTALAEWAFDEGLGISAAINLGNQTDICESDYLDYFATNNHTTSIMLHLEGVKDGKRFLETIRRVAILKPVVILKSGRSRSGQKSAASHTASLAGSDAIFSAACQQVGVHRADDLETLYDIAKGMALIRKPRGRRLLTISSSGGACTLAVDEAEALGLRVPELPQELIEELQTLNLPPLAHLSNPIDLGSLTADHYEQAALAADQHDVADIVLFNFADPVTATSEMVVSIANRIKASVAVCFMGGGKTEKEARLKMHANGVAVFSSPERAARGISAAVQTAMKNKAGTDTYTVKQSFTDNISLMSNCGSRFVLEPEAIDLLNKYHISCPANGFARTAEAAVEISNRLVYPVVMKIVSPDIVHKSDVGGVLTGLANSAAVTDGFKKMFDHLNVTVPKASLEGVLISEQAPDGLEVIIGAKVDSIFGKTIMFGLGGIFTEVLHDVTFRIVPIEKNDAEMMIRELKCTSIFNGYRGQPAVDQEAIVELLLAVSKLIINENNIAEFELNPVRLYENGAIALDARIFRYQAGPKVNSN